MIHKLHNQHVTDMKAIKWIRKNSGFYTGIAHTPTAIASDKQIARAILHTRVIQWLTKTEPEKIPDLLDICGIRDFLSLK